MFSDNMEKRLKEIFQPTLITAWSICELTAKEAIQIVKERVRQWCRAEQLTAKKHVESEIAA